MRESKWGRKRIVTRGRPITLCENGSMSVSEKLCTYSFPSGGVCRSLLYMFFAYGKIAVSLWNRSKNGSIHKAVAKAKMKSTRLVVAAVPVFVVCWAPTLELQLLEAYCIVENLSSKYLFIVYFWCIILQISSSSINPVIYAFLCPEFKRGVLRHCCFCCSSNCPLGRVEPVI